MKAFLDWIMGTKPGDTIQDGMFLVNKSQAIGLITKAFIDHSKATGKPFIRAEIMFSESDVVQTIISRLAYTNYVLRNGMGTSLEDEEFNVARMVGGTARVRFNNRRDINDRIYTEAWVLDIIQ